MFRFLHSSDLHIGKRFGNMPEDFRGRLREERHAALDRLAGQARTNGASTILLAGDTFDTETPTPAMLRQALAAMHQHGDLRWILLPGNHDSLQAEELWNAAREARPDNVTLATKAEPIALAPDVVLLPAPCTTRRPGRDLTDWMDAAATSDGDMRIGLAHGPIRDFSEDSGTADIVAPDRAERAGLDYLALGDWHGQMRVNERSWYSGTPEPDRFKHGAPGQALVVALAGHGAPPDVRPVTTGMFDWLTLTLSLPASGDAKAALQGRLPAAAMRRQTLLRLVIDGHVAIGERLALETAYKAVAPEFGYAELDTAALATDCAIDDLDLIDQAGALRQAAETLLAESADESLTTEARTTARDALVRLFSYCEAMER